MDLDKITKQFTKQNTLLLFSLDLSKALLDTIDHKILIKCDGYGIRGVAKNWLEIIYTMESKQ